MHAFCELHFITILNPVKHLYGKCDIHACTFTSTGSKCKHTQR